MDVQTMSSAETVFKKEEVPMIIAQFWQQRAALAEREASTLKEQLAASRGRAPAARPGEAAAETPRRPSAGGDSAREKESSDLVEDVRRLQSRLAQVENHTAHQRAKLLEELETKKKTIQRLQSIIEQQKDYNEIKKGLVILKSMKGGAQDGSDGAPASPPADKSMEVLKELQNEQTEAKGATDGPQVECRPPLLEPALLGFRGPQPRPPFLPGAPFPFAPFPTASGALASLASRSPSSPGERAERLPGRGSLSPPERKRCSPASEAGTPRQPSPAEPYRFDENDPLIPKSDPMETRLQEMLRYNMDKYANQSLDTLQLSRRVRELLAANNIGQRMFARYILGLSQGTVSELLSKPKTWEKLTEKGRDSYRKMHAWAVDDAAVCLLKAVIPKRGKESRAAPPSFVPRPEESAADERIAHILTEATQAMKGEPTPSAPAHEGTPSPQRSHSPGRQSPADGSREAPFLPLRRPGGAPGGPEEPSEQEKIARFYRDHLATMMAHRSELGPAFPLDHYQRLNLLSSLRSPEEVRLAMEHYNQELVKLMQHQHLSNGQKPLREDGERPEGGRSPAFTHVRPDDDSHGGAGTSPPPPLAGPLVPGLHPGGFLMHPAAAAAAAAVASGAEEPVTSASPLQRMASITNSLMTTASIPPLPPHTQRPSKPVMPPITQQQFDKYNNINTEQVVKQIKEHLSQYSLSQRLFGESVLGLSQGSVSDLLARPKPWHMLTQKGREPFIRMQMFLEDESAVHKLVASQYKIAPDKLMRTGCYNVGKRPNFGKPKAPELPRPLESPLPPAVSLPQFPGLPPGALAASRLAGLDPLMKYGLRLPPVPPLPMSVYETAAVTPELDTLYITTKIKEVLLANNIGQKLFGETVLGLSQGSVSELLSKPKPWHLLSIKGREPFIRMKMWLEDAQNIHKLQLIKTERKESGKRRRCQPDLAGDSDSADGFGLAGSPTSKKVRVLFSEEQKEALLVAFSLDPYPAPPAVEFLCQELGLAQRTVTNWFHNHRMRLKQQTGDAAPGREVGPGGQFEPLQFRVLLARRLQERCLAGPLGLGPLSAPTYLADEEEPSTGLDLTIKSDDGDAEGEPEGSGRSASSSPAPAEGAGPPARSRRKPAAPQWLPQPWAAEPRPVINGVCVMQTPTLRPPSAEPAPEPEPEPEPELSASPAPDRRPQPEPDSEPEPEPEPEQEQEPMEAEQSRAESPAPSDQ